MNNPFAKCTKYTVIAIFLVVAVVSLVLIGNISINYNISDYLNEETETRISLDILEAEFGKTSDVQVMIEDIPADTAKNVQTKLKNIQNVLTVSFDEEDEGYYKNGDALLVVLVNGDEYSEVANRVVEDIQSALNETFDGKVSYGGAVIEKALVRAAIEGEIPFILVISVLLAIGIMLLTSASWIEPIVLLSASGVAILINLGTNAILGEISYITNAVAAILQLALSIDYSIVLLHSYRAVKETEENDSLAMRRAIREVVKPVLASALTTVAGLLALLFMSFKIGADIGGVLVKSILISAITSLTLLPALLLVFDKLMKKTAKRDFVLKGRGFCKLSFRAGKVIVPLALVLVVACGVLQLGNVYSFTDGTGKSDKIMAAFGQNNTIVAVYPNAEENYEKENLLVSKLNAYKTAEGKPVLKNYSAYSNTARERYSVELAAKKMGISVGDMEMLFTMMHLYQDSSLLALKPIELIQYTDALMASDEDVQSFSDAELVKTVQKLLVIDQLMSGEHTAEEFYTLATSDVMEGTDLSLFAIKQMYGLYSFDSITDSTVDLETMLDFVISSSENTEVSKLFDEESIAKLTELLQDIQQYNTRMEMPLTQTEFQSQVYQEFGVTVDETTAAEIYADYFRANGQAEQSTIPFLKLMSFLAAQNEILDSDAAQTITAYHATYTSINANHSYEQFIPALIQIHTALSGDALALAMDGLAVQQLYIMYFSAQNGLPDTAVPGRTFVDFVCSSALSNPIVSDKLLAANGTVLSNFCIVDDFLSDTGRYDFRKMAANIAELQGKVESVSSGGTLDVEKISGIYIKYALEHQLNLTDAVEAKELLAFVVANQNNELLAQKASNGMRLKIIAAQAELAKASDLFIGENYSRMLLSLDLPNESEDSSAFVAFLMTAVQDVFGEDAHIGGLMVSTYDLQKTFDKDNTFISVFTIVSIFLIVMLVFRSLSLPIVLVTLIQGAIWIAMVTSSLAGPMFFMSYIVSTCILMGATIDYGILMSTNYVQHRERFDKKEALFRSVEAAMPTVFTSGMILTVCGLVIGLISSQNTISNVGFLIGKGALVSILMITLVLPSVLYWLDGFILKLSITKKNK